MGVLRWTDDQLAEYRKRQAPPPEKPVKRAPRPRKKVSKHEELFSAQLAVLGIGVVREFRFHPERQWRFDFAVPEKLVGVELEGGIWTQGRHTRGSGFTEDCEKYNAAAVLGWRVLRFTGDMISSGIAIQVLGHILGRAE